LYNSLEIKVYLKQQVLKWRWCTHWYRLWTLGLGLLVIVGLLA